VSLQAYERARGSEARCDPPAWTALGRAALLLVAALALAAGCLGTADPDEGTDDAAPGNGSDDRPALEAPVFEDPVPVTETNAAEPHAIAAPDGTRYVLDFRDLYRATGDGYEPVDDPFEDGGDSDLLVDDGGRLHYVGMATDDGGPQLPYHVRDANGTWDSRDLAPNASSVDRPWIDGEGDRLVVTYNDFEAGVNRVMISEDGGDTWSDPIDLPDPFAPRVGPPVVHGDAIVQPWRAGASLYAAVSTDAGETWVLAEGPETGDELVGSPTAAVDAAGTLYLAQANGSAQRNLDQERVQPRIRVWSSPDLGATWSDPVRVDGLDPTAADEDTTAIFPWVVAGEPGRVLVAYYEDATGTDPGSPTGAWFPAVSTSTTADRADAEWTGVRLTDLPVKNGSMCTRGAGCTSEDWRFRDYFTATLLPDGHPYVAFVRDTAPASPTNPSQPGAPVPVEVVAVRGVDGWTGR
jgi:hypothetical protein